MAKCKSKYTVGNYALRVRRSKTGNGLFTEEFIPKSACIIKYTGRLVGKAEQYSDSGKYLFWVGKNSMINGNIPSNKARFINHSCKPNCEASGPKGRVFISALRRIKAGEELTYDYGDEYFEKHIAPKGCRCTTCTIKDGP
ncbi:hypothetical protein A3D70_01235 [Candidatus Adlerbacteria bacterium RIFCSPHIGHO2_02_FULL_54_18]|uniref:SET domain-containing protein n=2 Tax=Candidatus Adleribacteriota TaxID=1752736 RepID=A0A1F4Y539_9BACT|nr:MAG: hypothetical protein A2949_02170 [Candidatus Adlerbacteria bacterium RIFCSPLOWO2_01_FULL_54_21b]OGC89042.1 MAG: hypothetical protein A3D70_01235 [Candidatus Adlerbacteria bacterium RIFCSPHIGHO2_02_FULL_54_18]